MRDKNKQENFTIEELKVIKTHDKTLIFRMECEDRIKKLRNRPQPFVRIWSLISNEWGGEIVLRLLTV